MITSERHEAKALPIANYSAAIAQAVEWLGDRYLLAKPINALPSRDVQAFLMGLSSSVQRQAQPTEL